MRFSPVRKKSSGWFSNFSTRLKSNQFGHQDCLKYPLFWHLQMRSLAFWRACNCWLFISEIPSSLWTVTMTKKMNMEWSYLMDIYLSSTGKGPQKVYFLDIVHGIFSMQRTNHGRTSKSVLTNMASWMIGFNASNVSLNHRLCARRCFFLWPRALHELQLGSLYLDGELWRIIQTCTCKNTSEIERIL